MAEADSSDPSKLLVDWALLAGQQLRSKQTGYVHYHYGHVQPPFDTIPLIENALFVLALLRSRTVEKMQEGMLLLKGLLGFQVHSQGENLGNFPLYLHQYPQCHDSTVALQLLAPFYWTIVHFGHILGSSLRGALERAAELAMRHSLAAHRDKVFPYSLELRLACAQLAFGKLWGREDWQQTAGEGLEALSKRQLEGWISTKHLCDMLIGLQMVYPSLENSPWLPLWKRMEETWHSETGTYVGPCLREWQEGEEPQASLYDLFGGIFSGHFSRRATILRPYHLYGVLLSVAGNKFKPAPQIVQDQLKQQQWKLTRTPSLACTLIEKKEPFNPAVDNTFTPFRLVWGDLQRVHTLVCQGGNYQNISFSDDAGPVQLHFDLPSDESESEQKKEIAFFVDCQPDISFKLHGHSASTFELGEEICIQMGERRLALVFELLQGDGTFLAHVMRGNRPSQIDAHGENRFKAYDWSIFLRTIRRENGCRVRATLKIN